MTRLVFALFAIALFCNACDEMFSSVKGEGPVTKETRQLTGFKGISLSASGDVYIKQGTEFKVVVETQKNIAEILETEVKNGVLEIFFKNGFGNVSADKLNIYVEAPAFEILHLLGSGNMTTENALTGTTLSLDLSGSGNIYVKDATYSKVKADIVGSGNIELAGTTESGDYGISGSGNVHAKSLKGKSVKAHITGSGDIECAAETDLDVSITGSGSVGYEGNAAVKSRVTGSGSVEKH